MEEFNLWDNIQKSFQDFAVILSQGVPRLVMVLVFFIAAYIMALVVSMVLRKTLQKISFDDLAVKLKLDEPLATLGIKQGLSFMVSKIVFWMIMLVVISTVANNLGVEIIKQQVQRVIDFIPDAISALLIIVVGYLIARKIRDIIANLTRSLGSGAGTILASILYYFIMVMVVITAIDQLGVKTDLISKNIIVIVGVILIAGAVAYGFAARDIMRNMLSSFYSKKNFYKGQHIRVKEVEGEILEIDSISVILQCEDVKVVLPAATLMDNKVEILDK